MSNSRPTKIARAKRRLRNQLNPHLGSPEAPVGAPKGTPGYRVNRTKTTRKNKPSDA